MKAKTYILQAGFLPIGQTDVTGWRTYSFHTGQGDEPQQEPECQVSHRQRT